MVRATKCSVLVFSVFVCVYKALILCSVLQISSPAADNARGFVSGQMFNRKGEVKDFILCSLNSTSKLLFFLLPLFSLLPLLSFLSVELKSVS